MSESAVSTALDRKIDLASPIVYDTVDARRLELIRDQVAAKCSDGELAHFLELCQVYELDPFAKEAWCVKSDSGKLLIMVGRDGLRKIAQRNGLHLDCDVVHKEDEFSIVRTPDGNRTVAHSYGNPTKRGEIVGAWAEVRLGGPTGKPMGYFYAALNEYRPANASQYSPWSKQESVMILAAAERQAVRQATPLAGLLVEGEDESAMAEATSYSIAAPGAASSTLPAELEELVMRARSIDPQSWLPIEVAARIPEPTDRSYDHVVSQITREVSDWLDEHEPADAEVVPDESEAETSGNEVLDVADDLQKRWDSDAEWQAQVAPLMHRYADLEAALDDVVGAGDEDNAEQLRDELTGVESSLDALGVPVGWVPTSDAAGVKF